MNKGYFLLLLVILAAFLIVGCSGGPLPPSRHPAEDTVEEMYAALSAGDTDAYMDTLLPEKRRRPNPIGLLDSLSVLVGPAAINLGTLADYSFKDVEASVVKADSEYVLVQAEGFVRYSAFMWELPFCDQHDVRLLDGEWYVDIHAAERIWRMERISEKRMQQLEESSTWAGTTTSASDLTGLLDGLSDVMEVALNQCES